MSRKDDADFVNPLYAGLDKLGTDEFRLLVRSLQMTGSDNDNEALTACRKVNAILKAHHLTFMEMFTEMQRKLRKEIEKSRPTIPQALTELINTLKPGPFKTMIMSFQEQFMVKGNLSDKQREVITKALKTQGIHLGWSVSD
jgi:alkylhydroperoxidase/carboxymuconolactone decarboxylase family protein YurZ